MLLELFCPSIFHDSIYHIDLSELKQKGITGLIVDFDNTLVERGSQDTPHKLRKWLEKVEEEGYRICVVSNNLESKIGNVVRSLNIPLVARAGKPRGKAFRDGMIVMKTVNGETAVIGDQLFTDVLGGNRFGLFTILVLPVGTQEMLHTKILRHLERWIIRRLQQRKMLVRI